MNDCAMHLRFLLLGCAVLLAGCVSVKLQPVEAHVTVDVNVKVDRAVAGLLDDIYGDSTTVSVPKSSTP